MKTALTAFALVAVFLLSCDDNTSTPPPPPQTVTETHVIRDIDYVKDKYFYFVKSWDLPGPREAIDVYRTVTPLDIIAHPDIQRIPGWVMPDSLGDGQAIRDAAAAINGGGRPSHALVQDFQLLLPGEDYAIFEHNGIVSIELSDPVPVSALKSIGVKYVNSNGVPVGGRYSTLGIAATTDTLMLRMLKAPDPRPQGPFASVWRLAIRNIYDLGWHDVDIDSTSTFTMVIEDLLNVARTDFTRPEGSNVPYLQIFGLDFIVDRPDLFVKHGLLLFPDPRAFAPDPANVATWTEGAFEFTGPYQAQYDKSQRIYDRVLNPTEELDVLQYIIRATLKRPAS